MINELEERDQFIILTNYFAVAGITIVEAPPDPLSSMCRHESDLRSPPHLSSPCLPLPTELGPVSRVGEADRYQVFCCWASSVFSSVIKCAVND